MTGRQIGRVLAYVLALAFVFFVFLWVGFAVQSRRAYLAGERALAEGDDLIAQGYFEQSIRSHCPFNTWGKRSAERLEAMARLYEEKNNIERAIDAYEALMTSLAAIDTGWSDWRRDKIARLERKVLMLREAASQTTRPL